MKNLLKFNVNSYVYFKPTELGMRALEEHYKGWTMIEPDENGFYSLQMWIFIRIFGEVFCATMESPVYHCEIYIEKKELEEDIDGDCETQS